MEEKKVVKIELDPTTEKFIEALNLLKQASNVFGDAIEEKYSGKAEVVDKAMEKYNDHDFYCQKAIVKEMLDYIGENVSLTRFITNI